MPHPTPSLAADFSHATRARWLTAVEKTLKGAGVDTLARRTPDGLPSRPLYTAQDSAAPADFDRAARIGERAWDIRAAIAHPDPARANAQILEALAGGASSVLIKIDPSGTDGVAVGSAEGLARVLDGVMLDVAPVALGAGFLAPQSAKWLAACAKASPAAPLAFHLDPLGAFAATGVSPGPIQDHLRQAGDLVAGLVETYPRASWFMANGRVVHEAGGSPAAELAFALACAVAYVQVLEVRGVTAPAAFERVVLGVAVDGDVLASIAKQRAARVLWRKIAGACGASGPARIEARSSRRMLTVAEPWTNVVRLTSAGFAAAVGGADAIVLGSFSDALGLPAALGRRLARNTQLILMEEARVGGVADPLAGAWAVETLTDGLARAAWSRFTAIEAAGGIVPALTNGAIASEVEDDRAELRRALVEGETKVVGVTDFVGAATGAVEVETASSFSAPSPDPRLPGPDSRCPPLPPIRLEEFAK